MSCPKVQGAPSVYVCIYVTPQSCPEQNCTGMIARPNHTGIECLQAGDRLREHSLGAEIMVDQATSVCLTDGQHTQVNSIPIG